MPKRPLPPIGFWSYARPDDELSGGQLSRLRALIRAELQQQYGREQIQLFQDISAISHGSRWQNEIRRALENSTFFIPILSPNFLQSEWCVQEVQIFQERQERLFDEYPDLPRTSRIFPIHYIDVLGIEGLSPTLDQSLRELQWFDFRDFRHHDFSSAEVRRTVSGFVTSVRDLLRAQVEQPDAPAPAPAPSPAPPRAPAPPSVVTAPAASPAAAAMPEALPPEHGPGHSGPEPAGAGGAGGGKTGLIIGAIVALLAVAALLAFLLLRRGADGDAAAASNGAAVVANAASAEAGAAAEATDAAPGAEEAPGGDLATVITGRWGDDATCETGVLEFRADGSMVPAEEGRWSTQGTRLVMTEPDGTAWRAEVEPLDDDASRIRVTGEDEEPATWYRCT